MKILLIKKDIVDNETLNKGIALVKVEALKIGLTLDFTIKETTQTFSSMPDGHGHTIVSPTQIFQEGVRQGYVFEEDALVCLVYDWTKVIPRPTNPHMGGLSMQIPVQFYLTFDNVFMQFFLHELSHYYLLKNGAPDLTHNYSPEFGQKPRHEWYLHLIKPYVKKSPITPPVVVPPIVTPTPETRWKHFKLTERTGSMGTIADLDPNFVDKIDKAREFAGIPFSINSGYRTVAFNASIGGSVTSPHINRTAVDVRARNWLEVRKIVEGAMKSGIIGITVYTNSLHVHLDMKSERLEVKSK